MSIIRPFRGIRPSAKFVEKIITPNVSYLKKIKKDNQLNFLNILISSNITKAKNLLKKMLNKKIISQDTVKKYYLYKITYDDKCLMGIVGKVNLKNYDDKKILGHEETFLDRIKERKAQLFKFNNQISPIYTTYKASNQQLLNLQKMFQNKPNYSIKPKDNCLHEMWVVEELDKKRLIKSYLNKIKKIYICDGHHRIQAMLKSGKKISPMIIAFPEKQVNIIDYNRLLKTNLSSVKIKKIIKKNFLIKKSSNKKKPKMHEIEMFLDKSWYLLKPLKKFNDLDVTILKKKIIEKITNNEKNIKFVSGIKNKKILEKFVNSKKFNVAFKLCPTNISQVISFAEKKKFMPPKSTWFHPKPLDGLITSKIIS